MFSRFSLKAKLFTLCFFMSVMTMIVGMGGYYGLHRVSQDYGQVAAVNFPKTMLANQMFLEYRQLRIELRTIGLAGITSEQTEQALNRVKEVMAKYEEAAERYRKTEYAPGVPFGPGEQELFESVQSAWSDFKQVGDRVVAYYRSGTPEGHAHIMEIFLKDCPESAAVYMASMQKLLDYNSSQAQQSALSARQVAEQSNLLSLIMIIGGMLLAGAVGYFFATSVSGAIEFVSSGLAQGASKLADAAAHINSSSVKLSTGASQQASALQETTAAVEQTSAMVAKNADNARRSSIASSSSQEMVAKGKEVVTEMKHAIDDIAESNNEIMHQIDESNREISEIVKVIAEIGSKTKVINDIVFQTKLLSFNASVEAARAGEHGKGFAVVAEEVGNLAQMSGNSAQEISSMLDDSIKKVEGIIANTKSRVESLIQSGKEKVAVGTQTAIRCEEVLDQIVTNVSDVGSMVDEISGASTEQAQGIQEISKAMSQLDGVAQENQQASEQTASAAEDLKEQVTYLRSMVNELNQTLWGVKHPSDVKAAPSTKPALSSEKKATPVLAFKKKAEAVKPPAQPAVESAKALAAVPSESDARFKDI